MIESQRVSDEAKAGSRSCLDEIVTGVALNSSKLEEHARTMDKFVEREAENHKSLNQKIDMIHAEFAKGIASINDRVNALIWRFNAAAITSMMSVILILIGIIGYLLVEGPPWAKL